jgi:hypothetical protein
VWAQWCLSIEEVVLACRGRYGNNSRDSDVTGDCGREV